ncbi:hypothetical protein Ocin01_13296 [Orchesella cincta]|uniref:Uncharacterized protein n=1 Tax=Orchesella cincta TaxID=48709 RepID=A0A1D2MK96_ORCCI|nr:hypothetical protein Ocin01_13296 [Orchesella cincta]
MRFVCDICPLTATNHQTVVIGHYEAWINHLLTPQHQTEQNLAMLRKSCWPKADYTAVVKNLPSYNESSADLYVDVAMQLSEYGFVEAIHHRKGTESDVLYVAIQLYETKPFPRSLTFVDGNEFTVTLLPRPTTSSLSENGIIKSDDRDGLGQRRRRLSSVSSNGINKSFSGIDIGTDAPGSPTSPVSKSLEKKDCSVQCAMQCSSGNNISSMTVTESNRSEKPVANEKYRSSGNGGKRIKYDKETLLLFCGVKALPQRFVDILNFPMDIVLEEAKEVDLEQFMMEPVVWVNISENDGGDMRRQGRKPNGETRWHGRRPMDGNNSWQRTQY